MFFDFDNGRRQQTSVRSNLRYFAKQFVGYLKIRAASVVTRPKKNHTWEATVGQVVCECACRLPKIV